MEMKMKQLLLILGLSLGLFGCGASTPTPEEKRIINNGLEERRSDYEEVTIDGEYVSDTVEGGAYGIQYAIYKYKNRIWKCDHARKRCRKN